MKIPVTTGFQQACALLTGLSIFQPLQVTLMGSAYAVRRFGYGPETVSPFLGITYCFQQLMCFLGVLSTNILVWNVGSNRYSKYIEGTYAMVMSALITFLNCRLLLLFGTSVGDSNITAYYWNLALSAYCFGAFEATFRGWTRAHSEFMHLGSCFAGTSVTVLHTALAAVLTRTGCDLNYWMMYYHLNWVILLSFGSGITWSILVVFDRFGPDPISQGGASNTELNEVFKRGWPYMCMTSVSLGLLFTVYPSVAVFQMLPFEKTHIVMRTCLCLQMCNGLVIYSLKKWHTLGSEWSGSNSGYNVLFFMYVPFISLWFLFIHVLHYPTSIVGKHIYHKLWVVLPLTMVYFGIGNFTFGCSFTALFANTKGLPKSPTAKSNGLAQIMTINTLTGCTAIIVCKFLFEGYIRSVRAAKAGLKSGLAWPTEGKSTFPALCHWLGNALGGGTRLVFTVWTTDIRTKILT